MAAKGLMGITVLDPSYDAVYVVSPLIGISRLSTELRMAEEQAPQVLSLDGWSHYKTASWLLLLGMIAWQ